MIESSLSAEKAELVALCSLPGVRRRWIQDLLTLYGSPSGAWDAVRHGLPRDILPGREKEEWLDRARGADPEGDLRALEGRGIRVSVPGEGGYPRLLSEIHDPPWVLFHRGMLPPGGSMFVALVGSRKATPYGLEVARWLGGLLAEAGMCVVSGAAYGVDSAAHAGALKAAGTTLAVLGCGPDVTYPRSNRRLFGEIEACGCILSEYPPGTPPLRHHFPARNRIIAGVSRGVVVAEASESSGALLTARFALAEGREVMAVPGQVFSPNSAGTNALIRSGAAVVTCPEDVLEALGVDSAEIRGGGRWENTAGQRDPLLEAVSHGASDVEDAARLVGIPVGEAVSRLSRMEVEGLVRRGPGGRYQMSGPRSTSHGE